LTAAALPERNAYPGLYEALDGLLDAVALAPSARGWVSGLIAYETMLLREMGYGGGRPDNSGDFESQLTALATLEGLLAHYLLAGRKGDVMAARTQLTERLARIC